MIEALKVWGFRKYYRLANRWAWRQQARVIQWQALDIPAPAGSIPVRVYHSDSGQGENKPLIVYFHGGGWMIGDLDTHHPFCMELSAGSGCTVVSVNYRLAPEHPFPAAADDCLAAVRWIATHLGEFGPGNGSLVLAGDSAGGNLALCTCLELDDLRESLAGVISIYPAVDHYSAGFASYVERAKGQLLTREQMRWFWDSYLASAAPESPQAQRAFPLRSDRLSVLPRTLVITSEHDPLRDEGIALAQRLRESDVETRYHHYNSPHGFACGEGPNSDHLAMMVEIVDWLR